MRFFWALPHVKKRMNDNVAVFCRLRSSDYSYITIDPAATHMTVDLPPNKSDVAQSSKNTQKVFNLDRIFTVDSSQDEIYQECAASLVDNFLQGYNCALMAYGGTGSGKTYTMMGIPNSQTLMGIIPRAIDQIWKSQKENVTVSFVEIYEEYVYDLLAASKTKHLKIVDDFNNMKVQGCKELPFTTVKEMQKKVEIAFDNRTKAATNMNMESSRSHAIVIFTCNNASLFMVDLAGAEDQADTHSTGKVLKQASAINKSLSELTNVMNALYQKQKFVNYRNSKLTTLLKKALGGNSKTTFVLTCNPVPKQLSMNLRTLQFGNRARSMANDAKLIPSSSSSDLTDWQAKYEEALAKLEEHNKTIAELQNRLLETSATSSEATTITTTSTNTENDEEKKNFETSSQNLEPTSRLQRRPSIMASVLEEADKAHLEVLLENDQHPEPSDSDSDSSCPALIITEATLQRMARPSLIVMPVPEPVSIPEPVIVPEVILVPEPDFVSKVILVPEVVSIQASDEIPGRSREGDEIPGRSREGDEIQGRSREGDDDNYDPYVRPPNPYARLATRQPTLEEHQALQIDYKSLEDSFYDLEVRLHEMEQREKNKKKVHYPSTVWGQVWFYISLVIIILGFVLIYRAHKGSTDKSSSTPEKRGYVRIGVAWATWLGGIAFLVACLFN